MRFWNQSPLLLSVENAGNIDPAGGQTPPPPLERVTDDSASSIISDYASEQIAARQEQSAPVIEPPPTDQTAQQAAQTDVQPTQEVQPPAQPEVAQEAAIAAPESFLAPIFDLVTANPSEAIPQAVDLMRDFYQRDPLTYKLFANAVLQASPKSAVEFVLRTNGIPQEKVGEFQAWIARGGDKLPEPVEYPVFDATVTKLGAVQGVAEDEANQWVRLASGLELNLADQRDKPHFELERRLYDSDVKDKQQQRADTERQQQEDEQRKQDEAVQAQQNLTSRVDFYVSDRQEIVDSVLADTINNLGPDDKIRGAMLQSLVTNLVKFTDPALSDMYKQIDPPTAVVLDSITTIGDKVAAYVREGAGFEKGPDGKLQMTGRVKELADQQARAIRVAVTAIKDKFNKDIVRLNQAELAATATAPQIPPDARTVAVQPAREEVSPENDTRASIIEDYRRDLAASSRR